MYATRSDASSGVVSRQQAINDSYDKLLTLAKVGTCVCTCVCAHVHQCILFFVAHVGVYIFNTSPSTDM